MIRLEFAFLRSIGGLALATLFERTVLRPYWRLSRGMTLGVRGVAMNAKEEVCLIRHTYAPGWHFPGGGVEAGETIWDAVDREMSEEAAIVVSGRPRLHGLFANRGFPNDHVAVFVVSDWQQPHPPEPDREIAEHGFFPVANLPDDTTPGTRRRLDEILNGATPSAYW